MKTKPKSKKPTLKPCAHCGSECTGIGIYRSPWGFCVVCHNCGIRTHLEATSDYAAAVWNRREQGVIEISKEAIEASKDENSFIKLSKPPTALGEK